MAPQGEMAPSIIRKPILILLVGMDFLTSLWLVNPSAANCAAIDPQKIRVNNQERRRCQMLKRGTKVVEYVQKKLVDHSQIFVRVTFGAFIGSLVVLLILLYTDAPIVGL